MAIFYIILAGICETLWPIGFKLSQAGSHKDSWIMMSLITMTLSVVFFYYGQKHIPLMMAYPIWTGLGAIGTFLAGVIYFHDSATWISWLGICLVVGGISLLEKG